MSDIEGDRGTCARELLAVSKVFEELLEDVSIEM